MSKETKKKRGRKRKNRQYFTSKVDEAIVIFNNSENKLQKEKLYKETIYPAFDKLAENLINTWNWPYIELSYEDLKHEVVAFLTEKIDRFSSSSGKAFSYFSIVGKNFLIAKNNKSYSKSKRRGELGAIDEERDISAERSQKDYQESLSCYIEEWLDKMEDDLEDLFETREDIEIADSILELFRIRKNIETFNKKALYILIRERARTETPKITKVLNVIKLDFYEGFKHYLNP